MSLPIVLVPHPHVRQDTSVLGGSPYVAGSRVPVRRLFAFFQRGTSVERILKRYPQLGAAKVLDALAFALDNPEVMEADLKQEEELLAQAGHKSARKPVSASQIELPFAASGVERSAEGGRREHVERSAPGAAAANHGGPSPADRPASPGRGERR